MSSYYGDKPKFSERLRGKSSDEILQEMKQKFDEHSDSFFEPSTRSTRDPFERHAGFSRGFPFDEDSGLGRRNDIRSHLNGLASRHPELADQLLGPPWDIPFHGLGNRRRNSNSSNGYQSHPDEDARSQASGSSAASGASGASSHSETEVQNPLRNAQELEQNPRKEPIPQYGLRNTVDIGQHRHNMDNFDKNNQRGQRSMSAPPENRQQPQQQPFEQQQPQGPQRFVSRVDIAPQQQQQQRDRSPAPAKPQPQPQQQGNVRHIPIFVEGRDEPVIPRDVHDGPAYTTFQKPQSPPPTFKRPREFTRNFTAREPQNWAPRFKDPFFQAQSQFEPTSRWSPVPPKAPQTQQFQQQPHRQPPMEKSRGSYQEQQQQQEQEQEPEEPPKPRAQVLPKDPLERVSLVQQEVDSLTEQVKEFTGNSRKDKQYIYLDEMLTRELIKLDDIETEGKENVRQARKNAIKSIQDSISLLESMTLSTEQQKQKQVEGFVEEALKMEETLTPVQAETMETETQQVEAIPLPPCPEPGKKDENASQISVMLVPDASMEVQPLAEVEKNAEEKPKDEPVPPVAEEVGVLGDAKETNVAELDKVETEEKGAKSPKKGKKKKKPEPVSEQAIPLPPPEAVNTAK